MTSFAAGFAVRPAMWSLVFALSLAAGVQAQVVSWPNYNKGYDGQRYSPLKQITTRNVKRLKPVCEAQLGDAGAFQAGPVVIGRILYATTSSTTVALDAATCKIRWQHIYRYEQKPVSRTNRGVAYADGRIYRGTGDGRILALDAASGKELWRVKAGNPELGEFFSAAPIVWQGSLFIGKAGSDWGIRGQMLALDANDGRALWHFNLVPKEGEPGFATWKIPATAETGGGGTWSSYTLDDETGELFVSVGNPAPSFNPDARPGDNLYTDSLVVLDARTGKLNWHYQVTPNDAFDLELAAAPVIYRDAQGRRMVALGSKDGYLYGIDRLTHARVFRTPVTTVMDPMPKPSPEGVRICPGFFGGVEWNGPALAGDTIYVGAVDLCNIIKSGRPAYEPGRYFHGTASILSMDERDVTPRGWLYAIDATTGQPRWKFHADSPLLAGVTPTAGGLVFTGDVDGNLLAFDAHSGKPLFKHQTGGAMAGGVVTYEVDGVQYIAATSGNVSRGPMFSLAGTPKIVILSTRTKRKKPEITKVAEDISAAESKARFHGMESYLGSILYLRFCASCHGANGDGSLGPALRGVVARKDGRPLEQIIRDPRSATMPRLYPKPLGDTEVDQLVEFLKAWK